MKPKKVKIHPTLFIIPKHLKFQSKIKTTNLFIEFLGRNCQKLGKPHAMKNIIEQCHILCIQPRLISKTTFTHKIYNNKTIHTQSPNKCLEKFKEQQKEKMKT